MAAGREKHESIGEKVKEVNIDVGDISQNRKTNRVSHIGEGKKESKQR